MKDTTKKENTAHQHSKGVKLFFYGLLGVLLVVFIVAFCLSGENPDGERIGTGFFSDLFGIVEETEEVTFGVDVAKYQGIIDWEKVAKSGVDFAIVRVGYRGLTTGEITEDPIAKYNMQEASKQGIKLGAYFFSTAITAEEAIEEANWVADYIRQYPITYPVAFDCERFNESNSRQYGMTREERTDVALAFLQTIEERGYSGMFYGSRNDMEESAQWDMERISEGYKVWVAQYPEIPYPETIASSYSGHHHMWQFSSNGVVPGISTGVDLNIAYFGYTGEKRSQEEASETVAVNLEVTMDFRDVDETVTAKQKTNLRDIPSQDTDAQVVGQLHNGETARRIGISDSGWSKLEFGGEIYYAVSSYLTTDMNYVPQGTEEPEDGIETVFHSMKEMVTAKDTVNLRTLPSVTNPESKVVATLNHGEMVQRVGVSDNGWSKIEHGGNTYYAVSSYLTNNVGDADKGDTIETLFQTVNESVTAKIKVNLRSMPSVENKHSEVVAQLKNGEVITRTGINEDVGWSRVEYNGMTLYCVSSYLKVVEK